MLNIRTLRRSAVTPSKDTFRPSNIDFLKPQRMSLPTVYNMNCSLFDTNMTPIIENYKAVAEISMKKSADELKETSSDLAMSCDGA